MKPLLTSLKAVSEEIRVRIIMLLLGREACVCELMAVFRMAQSKLSHHLIALRNAGLVQDEKRGKWNYYRLNPELLTPANKELITSISRWLGDTGLVARDRRELESVKRRMNICC